MTLFLNVNSIMLILLQRGTGNLNIDHERPQGNKDFKSFYVISLYV